MKSRFKESRIIRIWVINTIFNLLVFVVGVFLFCWINKNIILGVYKESGLDGDSMLQLIKMTMIPVLGSQGTATTAVIARYGLREMTGNLGGNNSNTATSGLQDQQGGV